MSNPNNNTSYLNTIREKNEKEYIMKAKKQILKFIQNAYNSTSESRAGVLPGDPGNPLDPDRL